MYSMIAIIPAILVIHIVDTVKGAAEVAFRITFINKAMLRPIAHHHDKSGIEHGNDKNHERCLEIDETHQHAKQNKREFAEGHARINLSFLPIKKIHKRVHNPHQ